MIYYKIEGDKVIKCNVTFNKEELENIYQDLINNCSRRRYEVVESTLDSIQLFGNPQNEKYTNIFKQYTGKRTSYSDTSPDLDIYQYEYLHIMYPKLADIINKLLNNDSFGMYDLMSYKVEYPIDYDSIILEERKKILGLIDTDINEARKELDVLAGLKDEKELNKNNTSTDIYLTKLHNALSINELESIPLDVMLASLGFFNESDVNISIDSITRKLVIDKKNK